MTARGEPDEPDALRTSRPPAADLSPQRVQRHRVLDVERIAEHAGRHAYLAELPSHWLGFMRSMCGIPATGQHDHVRAGRFRTCRRHGCSLRSFRLGERNLIACLGQRPQASRPARSPAGRGGRVAG